MRKHVALESFTGDSVYDSNSLESMGCHLFFGEVNTETSYAACEFILKSNLMQQNADPITMIFNSVGGDTSDGFAVIDLMGTSRLPVATVGVGNMMSMGVLLVAAGSKGYRALTKNTTVMAHQFAGYFSGKQHELIATQTAYNMLEESFIRHFLRHSKMSEKQIRDVLFSPTDRYLTPAECRKFGLCDRVVEYFDAPIPVKKPRVGRSSSAQ